MLREGSGGRSVLVDLVILAALSALLTVAASRLATTKPRVVETAWVPVAPTTEASTPPSSPDDAPSFRVPTGDPPSLACDAARRIVRQFKASLAYAPASPAPESFATSTADWLDPSGLWSVAPDSPVGAVLAADALALIRELDEDPGRPCGAARNAAAALVRWVDDLATRFERARGVARPVRAALAAREPLFNDEERPARVLAALAGERLGALEREFGPTIAPYVDAARRRLLPTLDGRGWEGVVLAAAVRAYVRGADPHGAWAPLDEEASIYDLDLDSRPPDVLWDTAVRTVIGVRVESSPLSPLREGDVVLSIAGVTTAGLSADQLDQLVYAATDDPAPVQVVALRAGERGLTRLEIVAGEVVVGSPVSATLPAYRVSYGSGDVLVIEVHEVKTDLSNELLDTLDREGRDAVGLVLDLRDNGGGSTDAAVASLGIFLPGAPLFPMVRRDGSVEVDRAPDPPGSAQWTRPVAAMVDSDTASAAEMLAGALLAYGRGPVVGQRTYGKGCAQEYVDDETQAGVLRVTTLLYALPDGSPVQRVGVEPSIVLPAPARGRLERERDAPNAPPTWRGPDVRDRLRQQPWPEHHGTVGPCVDPEVCRALVALGQSHP